MNVKITIADRISEVYRDQNYKRVFLIADVHNDYKSYCRMRDVLKWNVDDLVIIDGDLIDRGGDTADPLSLLNEVRYPEMRSYDVCMIKGNHELYLAENIRYYLMTGKLRSHYNSLYILAKALSKDELLDYANWLSNLPLAIKMRVSGFKKDFIIAHASTRNPQSVDESLMGDNSFYSDCIMQYKKYGHFISVVGHTPTSGIRNYLEGVEDEDSVDNGIEWEQEHPEQATKKRIVSPERTNILRTGGLNGNRLWCIDCGNGYRGESVDPDDQDGPKYPGKLGCIEINNGKIFEHYF